MVSQIAEPLHCESDQPAEGPWPFGERNKLLKYAETRHDCATTVQSIQISLPCNDSVGRAVVTPHPLPSLSI